MKKFINDPDAMVEESLNGFAAAYPELVRVNREPVFVARAQPPASPRVALISGGGAGHEPLHIGFVGDGMLAAACPGQVFTSPTPDQIVAAAAAVDNGCGVLLVVKNYNGDVMNFEMAAEMLGDGCRTVVVTDDAAMAQASEAGPRRGVAGTIVVHKMTGALAAGGADLERCRSLAERVNARTRSFGVSLTSCTIPALGEPTFPIPPDAVEYGVGIHGEPGCQRVALRRAADMARDMIERIAAGLPTGAGREVLLLTNGFAATPLAELYLMHGAAERELRRCGYRVARSLIGNFCTVLDMAGCSFTVTVLDDELTALWDAPARTAALTRA